MESLHRYWHVITPLLVSPCIESDEPKLVDFDLLRGTLDLIIFQLTGQWVRCLCVTSALQEPTKVLLCLISVRKLGKSSFSLVGLRVVFPAMVNVRNLEKASMLLFNFYYLWIK